MLVRDIDSLGRAMIANTEAQRSLHPDLVGQKASQVIESAIASGAVGWKVNGAGGDGGSVTVLSASSENKEQLDRRIAGLCETYRVLPIRVSSVGLRVEGGV